MTSNVKIKMVDGSSVTDSYTFYKSIAKDWINPEEGTYAATGATSSGAATNVTTAFLNAMTDAVAQKKKFVTRGYFDGTRKWFKITPGFEIPDGTVWEVEGKVGIIGSTASGILFRWRNTPYIRGDLVIDGGNTGTTIATAYTSDHQGMVVAKRWKSNTSGTVEAGLGYGTYIDDAVIEGLFFQNFGGLGLETYYLRDSRILNDISGQRLGWAGTIHMSPLRVKQTGGIWDDIWPGIPAATVYESNAYGVGASHWSAETQPDYMEFKSIHCEDVTGWEGFDIHGGKNSGFSDCTAVNCSQGFVLENHASGVTGSRNYVRDCRVVGYGTTTTRDSQPYYSLGGIICNATSPAAQSQQIDISAVNIYNTGEGRPSTQNGAGIVVRGIRNLRITGATILSAYQTGINLIGTNTGVDNVIFCDISGVLIDGVVSHASVQRGISAGTHVLGVARSCFVQGIATKAEAYYQASSPTYIMNYGLVGNGATSTENAANIAYGAT